MSKIDQLRTGELDIVEYTQQCLSSASAIDKDHSFFNDLADQSALAQAEYLKKNLDAFKDKKLFGVMISAKDAICVKGVHSRGGSRILTGYKPVFDATVIRRIKDEGGIIIGKTAQDEFGFGSFSTYPGLDLPIPKNPFDVDRACGGSSGGAAGIAQKADFAHISLGESTGGSIASPSSFCGVFGLTPTYGRNSRFGLMDYGNSLDKIGPIGKHVKDVALLQSVIGGYDNQDSTSLNEPQGEYNLGVDLKGKTIGVIKEAFAQGVDPAVEKSVRAGIAKLENAGAEVKELSLEFPLKYSLAAYYVIATSEASTNLSKYAGMRYGQTEELNGTFNEYFTQVRSSHFGQEAKRRIILGTFARMSGFRDAFYMKAAQVRTCIIEEYKKAFKEVDALVSPTTPILPPTFAEIEKLTPLQHYMMDTLLVGPNLAGLPHLNVPVEQQNGLPVGMLLLGDHLQEETLLQLGEVFDQ